MAFCPNCGSALPENSNNCPNCGAPVNNSSFSQPGAAQPAYDQQQPQQPQQPAGYGNSYGNYQLQPVAPVPVGGMIAWSIITIFLCTIPGVVGLVYTLKINKSTSVDDQQKALKTAKIWCTVGTVLGILSIIGTLAANGALS